MAAHATECGWLVPAQPLPDDPTIAAALGGPRKASSTISTLESHRESEQGMRLIVLQLGNLDLTSSAASLMVKVLAAMADFERDLIIERTHAGQPRARAEGKHMGRPAKTTETQRQVIRKALAAGATVTSMAGMFKVSRATIIGIRDAVAVSE